MKNLLILQAATLAARARTGDKSIATSVQSGLVRIESVTYGSNGVSTINSLTADMTVSQAVDFLNAI